MTPEPLRLLCLTAEEWPSSRVELAALFGKYLPRFGVASDLVTDEAAGGGAPWPAGLARLTPRLTHPGWGALRKFLHQFRCLLRVRAGDYAAIQVRDQPLIGVLACLVARRRGLPCFYWVVSPPQAGAAVARRDAHSFVHGLLRRLALERVILPHATQLFVSGEGMKTALLARGVAVARVSVLPMGVDGEALAARAGALPARRFPGRRCVVHLGPLEVGRRTALMFEMLALLRPTHPDLCLLLVGDGGHGADSRWLRTHAETWGVADMIYYTGWLPAAEAWSWVRLAEVGIAPWPRGEREDCAAPLAALEYLALGLPVLVSDNPEQALLVGQSGGGVCCSFEAKAFAAGLARLLDDPQAAREMGRIGREFVRRERDYARLAAQLAELYRRLLAAGAQ